MSHSLCIRLANSAEDITSALEAATNWLAPLRVSNAARDFARLAIEELATNWMKYGCAQGGHHEMVFDLSVDACKLVLRATDDSPPFNPMHAPQPPIHAPIKETSRRARHSPLAKNGRSNEL
jgi:anti-sigma regulatory factor (Ser/Thr protein kinase)